MVFVVKRWVAVASLATLFAVGAGGGWLATQWWSGSTPLAAPGPASRGAPAPSRPAPGGWYRVEPNDTLSEVSQRAYGTTRRVGDLLAANPGLDPARIRPGALLYVPIGSEPAPGPAAAPPRTLR